MQPPQLAPVPTLESQSGASFSEVVNLMRILLGPDGCPWDREQTFRSLRRYVQEEASEVIDAIDEDDRMALREELGDLALQVAFLSELARAEGSFGPDDVMHDIVAKLIRRHPHVFGDAVVDGPAGVIDNWELIKQQEKAKRPLLGGVPRSLPALNRAQRLSDKAASVGFDWDDASGSRAKVSEELAEVEAAVAEGKPEQVEAEIGDLLFAVVNWSRHLGVDAEMALRGSADRFQRRFNHVEARVKSVYGSWRPSSLEGGTVPLAELDSYWDEAKGQGL